MEAESAAEARAKEPNVRREEAQKRTTTGEADCNELNVQMEEAHNIAMAAEADAKQARNELETATEIFNESDTQLLEAVVERDASREMVVALEDEKKRLREEAINRAARLRTTDESGTIDERVKRLEDRCKKL